MKKIHTLLFFFGILNLNVFSAENMIWGTVPLKDSVLIESISNKSFDPNSTYALSYNSTHQMILLQNGVQIQEIDPAIQNILETKYTPQDFTLKALTQEDKTPKTRSLFEQLRNHNMNWMNLGNWPCELIFRSHIQLQTSELSEERDQNSLSWMTKVNPNIWFGIGLTHINDIGSYSKTLYLKDSVAFNSWLWSFRIAIPFVQYQLQKSNTRSTPFLFLEPNTKTSLIQHQASLLKLVKDSIPTDFNDNYLHSLDFKVGYFHLKYWMDEDIYKDKITQYMFQDLPLGTSTWWMGITEGTNTWAPGFGFQFAQINLGSYTFRTQNWHPHLSINSGFWWRGPSNFSFDFGIEFHIPQFFPELKL